MKDISLLENIIIGRVDPHIYAFTTGTVPDYLKIGDTYRPVSVRLNEWKEYFPDLEKQYEKVAKVDNDVYFRDFAIHYFLENEKRRVRLQQNDLPDGVYYSKEFFKEATDHDIVEAIEDITKDYQDKGGKYQFYNAESRLAETFTYARTETYDPRPNQEKAISAFKNAVDAGRTNLLMYAVMRFGKSFTSMCCALEMGKKDSDGRPHGADIVTIVSAKADVKEEWKKTVESHTKFADYVFVDGNALLSNESIIKDTLSAGKKVAIFLTLQDLQGEEIKEKHKEVFESQIDLLIVDETHFGARAEKHGQVLRELGKDAAKATQNKKDSDDFIEATDADEQINKSLNAKVKLHLSGTPYRILMGSEFTKEDIIAFYQFTDIVKEQEAWDKEHILSDDVKEWDNPYYGFPQMIRFALNPNESTRQRMKELKESGISFAFSALLKPKSVKKADDGSHKQFVYEKEILDLLEVIDGSKDDDELLGFLDYDKTKEGNMCRHIVMVLPYCASCDAMEALIRNYRDKFKNLNEYEIVNISGLDVRKALENPQKIKGFIHHCEDEGKKTLTLTVNRMLTGSTVEEWDTMLFLKDTASPQEYDQAIFRLQNQYVKKYIDDDGNVIKYNMKPQTLLVDFMPGRMFTMQEQKAQIYNVNVDEAGNSKLEERLQEELRVFPIIVMNSDKMEKVEAADILNAVSEYSKSRGVAEETLDIPVDLSLMDIDVIRRAIERENELGSKAGLSIKATECDGSELDTGTPDDGSEDTGTDEPGDDTADIGATDASGGDTDDEKKADPIKQFRSYYARILFFAFLTRDTVISLEEIISKIETENNARIAKHIGISKPVLESIQNNINKFILRDLDYKIHNLNKLSNDTSVNPLERATVAVHKFGKLGESEVITPKKICDEMVALVPDDGFTGAVKNGHKVLDIAGKAGEFALAIYERYCNLGYTTEQIKDMIYTIPTSGITYEFTRMIYEILGLNVANIAEKFNDYELLKIKKKYIKGKKAGQDTKEIDYDKICKILSQNKPFNKITIDDEITEGDDKVNFDVVVGNPPYQENIGTSGVNKSLGKQLFPHFMKVTMQLSKQYSSMIVPSKWFTAKAQDGSFLNLRESIRANNHFKRITNYLNGKEVFSDVSTGSVMHYLTNSSYYGNVSFTDVQNGKKSTLNRPLFEEGLDVVIPMNSMISILHSVIDDNFVSFDTLVTGRNPFGVPATDKELLSKSTEKQDIQHNISILCAYEAVRYISKNEITRNQELVDKWKVCTAKINGGAGTVLDGKPSAILGKTIVLGKNQICSNTLLAVGAFDNKKQALNLEKYMNSKFFRFMLGIKKNANVLTSNIYSFVPMQDFTTTSDIDWSKTIPKIDKQLYDKYGLTPEEIAFIESTIKPMEPTII